MSVFFDTNILVYAQQNGAKADKARTLLAEGGVVSVQVLNEFAAVVRRKPGKEWDEIGDAIDDALALVDPPLPLTMALHVSHHPLAGHVWIWFSRRTVCLGVERSPTRIRIASAGPCSGSDHGSFGQAPALFSSR